MNMRWWRRSDTVIDIEWSWVAPAERVKRRDLSTWFSIKGCFNERIEEGISLEKVCDMEEYIEEKIWYNWEREDSTKLWLEEIRLLKREMRDSFSFSCSILLEAIDSLIYINNTKKKEKIQSRFVPLSQLPCFDLLKMTMIMISLAISIDSLNLHPIYKKLVELNTSAIDCCFLLYAVTIPSKSLKVSYLDVISLRIVRIWED